MIALILSRFGREPEPEPEPEAEAKYMLANGKGQPDGERADVESGLGGRVDMGT